MRGVILAGGTGSRLLPLTEKINKHLLPVYNKPMIFYPILMLKRFGIIEILVITNKENAGLTAETCGDGSRFGVSLTYKVQEYNDGKQTGIAKALELAESFSNNEPIAVLLGDNIFNFSDTEISEITNIISKPSGNYEGAYVVLKEVNNPNSYGVALINEQKQIITEIEEKPNTPRSNYAITGFYLYDNTVFKRIKLLEPSPNKEYEITSLNKLYLKEGLLHYIMAKGDWIDAGTFDGLLHAAELAKDGRFTQ